MATRADYEDRFGKDNADYLMETLGAWSTRYERGAYLDTGLPDAGDDAAAVRARDESEERGWRFERVPALNQRLLAKFVAAGHLDAALFKITQQLKERWSALGEALMHVAGNFYRDYLLEKIEHRLSSGSLSPSVYPRTSLGPGQRFLSKGCYVVKPAAQVKGGLAAVSALIIP